MLGFRWTECEKSTFSQLGSRVQLKTPNNACTRLLTVTGIFWM